MVSSALAEVIAKGIAAVAFSVAAYVYIRWWERFAVADSRFYGHLSHYVPAFMRPRGMGSYPLWSIQAKFGVVLAVVISACVWIVFVGAVVAALQGKVPQPAPAPQALSSPPTRDVGGAVFILALSALLWLYGIHHILFRRGWARWNQWLYNTELPLDAPYPKVGDPGAESPHSRWVAAMSAVGASAIVIGSVLMWIALFRFRLPR